MAQKPRDNSIEIEFAMTLPCDEWFDLYSLPLKRCVDYSRRMITGFNCIQRQRKSSRSAYYISKGTKEELLSYLRANPHHKGLDLPHVMPRNVMLDFTKTLPTNEWFSLYKVSHGIKESYAKKLIKRLKCIKSKFKGGIIHYYLNEGDKNKLLECITENPLEKSFDITVMNPDVNNLWDKLLGVKQGIKNETN